MRSVYTTVRRCPDCGTIDSSSRHADPDCKGPVICVADKWICGRCGDPIAVADDCIECGGSATLKRREVRLDIAPEVSPASLERAIHEVANEYRRENGRRSLTVDHHLAGIARAHSRHMATADFFAHETPDGMTVGDRYDRADYDWRRCGENLARRHPSALYDATAIATELVERWMNSPGHRKTLLDPDWKEQGIGIYYGRDGAVYATQNFA